MEKRVHIIGGGFSGLSLAYYLVQKGYDISIYEKDRFGGLLGTVKSPYGIAENAANGIMAGPSLIALCEQISAPLVFAEQQSKKRYIHRPQKSKTALAISRWPFNLQESLGLIKYLFLFVLNLITNKSKIAPIQQETLYHWGERNFGITATENLLQPAMSGIYASDLKSMSASLILGKFFKANRTRTKSLGLVSFTGGMQDLVNSLTHFLKSRGVKFYTEDITSEKISELAKTDRVVLATACHVLPSLLKNDLLTEMSQKIKYLPLISCTLFFNAKDFIKEGFGCLFTKASDTKALGVLWNKFIFACRGENHSETWILGGDKSPELMNLTDTELLASILQDRSKLFFSKAQPLDYKITRWQKGLPQYSTDAESAIAWFNSQPYANQNIFFHGNYLGGIGLSQILERSQNLSQILETTPCVPPTY